MPNIIKIVFSSFRNTPKYAWNHIWFMLLRLKFTFVSLVPINKLKFAPNLYVCGTNWHKWSKGKQI